MMLYTERAPNSNTQEGKVAVLRVTAAVEVAAWPGLRSAPISALLRAALARARSCAHGASNKHLVQRATCWRCAACSMQRKCVKYAQLCGAAQWLQ